MGVLNEFVNQYQIIKQIPSFTKLGWFDLQKIARKAVIEEYKKGDVISREGNPPDFFYCVVSGRLQAYTTMPDGTKGDVDFIHRGMYFGLISVFTGKPHSITFQAINDSVILKIAKEDFHEILKSIPRLGVEFSEVLSQRIRRQIKGGKSFFQHTIVSVYSPLPKTGSSTYALNLAKNLKAETGEPVVLVSLTSLAKNPQRDEGSVPLRNLKELIERQERVQEIADQTRGVDLLHAGFDPADEVLRKNIAPFVSNLVNFYRYVVVDLPTEMDDLVLETLTQSDLIHLMTVEQNDGLALTRSVIDRLETVLRVNFQPQKIKVILRTESVHQYPSFREINRLLDFDICAMLPHLGDDQMEGKSPQYEQDYQRVVRRIAREIGGVLTGLALGGGAAWGLAHIGVLKELEKEKVPIDVVSGSSMGALIASFWAIGMSAQEIEQIAMQFQKKIRLLRLVDPSFSFAGIIGGRAIRSWLKKYLGDRTFYTTKIPLKILAYDLTARQDIVIESGSILDAVCQSIAIPGVINPTRRDNRVIIDGGVLNPVPTNILLASGVRKIIAVNVLKSPDDVTIGLAKAERILQEKARKSFWRHPWHFVTFRLGRFIGGLFRPNMMDIIIWTLQATEYLIADQSGRQADVNIHPDLADFEWFELHRVTELASAGERAAHAKMPAVKALVMHT